MQYKRISRAPDAGLVDTPGAPRKYRFGIGAAAQDPVELAQLVGTRPRIALDFEFEIAPAATFVSAGSVQMLEPFCDRVVVAT